MLPLKSPKSPRSVAQSASPDALNPASPSRDINAIVEDAAKRFEVMDEDLKSLLQDMKDYQASMANLNENRLKTAKHLQSFAANAPFANFVDPPHLKAMVGTEAPPTASDSGGSGASKSPSTERGDEADDKTEPTAEDEDKKPDAAKAEPATETEDEKPDAVKTEATTETEEKKPDAAKTEPTTESEDKKPEAASTVPENVKEQVKKLDVSEESKLSAATQKSKVSTESFAGIHESAYRLSKKYHAQYGDYLLAYLENWEQVVSSRINGLLIHYRELQENATHYHKKVGGLLTKVDKSKNVGKKLANKLDRNEIKEMGAMEARDTVGEHLYLYIEEVMERAWRDVFPLLLRFCRFEADFSAAQANVLAGLVTVSRNIQEVGENEDCDIMGRLEDLQKKHPEEVYTQENPFIKLTPIKKKPVKQHMDGESVSDESHDVDQASTASHENVEV